MRGNWTPRWSPCQQCGVSFWRTKPSQRYCHQGECEEQLQEARRKSNHEHQKKWSARRLSYRDNQELYELNEKAKQLEPTTREFVRAINGVREARDGQKGKAYLHLSALALAAARKLGNV